MTITNFRRLPLQAFQIANLIREYTEVMNLVAAENLAIETLANGNGGVGSLPLPPLLHPSQQLQQQNPQTQALQQQQQQQQQLQQQQQKHLLAKGNRPASMQFRSSTTLVAPQPS